MCMYGFVCSALAHNHCVPLTHVLLTTQAGACATFESPRPRAPLHFAAAHVVRDVARASRFCVLCYRSCRVPVGKDRSTHKSEQMLLYAPILLSGAFRPHMRVEVKRA